MSKKIISMLIACVMLCSMTVTAFAATNYFSGSTGKMNSLNGLESAAWNVSSGSINTDSKVNSSGVAVNVTVSTGSSPFLLYVEAPNGIWYSRRIGSSGSVTFTEFNGQNAKGTWKVSIQTTGTVSTATANLKVNYTY